MANLTVTITENQVQAALQAGPIAKLNNPGERRSLYGAWANYGERLAVQAYRTESAPFGSGWPRLKPATLARTPRRRGKLRVSGTLFVSTVGQVTQDGAQIGSNQTVGGRSLLAIHQFGAPRASIPARRVLPIDDQGDPLPEFAEGCEGLFLKWLSS